MTSKSYFYEFTRSKEQKELDLLALEMMVDRLHQETLRYFLKSGNYHYAEKLISIIKYTKLMAKIDLRGRLNPTGDVNGIMIVGVNPSTRSSLKNLWDDPFGKYFGKMLDEAGLDRSKIWMSNIYKKPTEENRPLNEKEIKEGITELKYEVGFVSPTVLVTLGKQPATIVKKYFPEIPQVYLQHPAYIIRRNSPDTRSRYISELTKLKAYEPSQMDRGDDQVGNVRE